MRIIFILIWKELLQVVRNRAMIPILTVIPIVQLILLSFAATNEVKKIGLAVCDNDHSTFSRRLREQFLSSDYFVLKLYTDDEKAASATLEDDQADAVLVIPPGFERQLLRGQPSSLQLQVNAINGVKGGLAGAYAGSVIQSLRRDLSLEIVPVVRQKPAVAAPISVSYRHWYNPELEYQTFMVPGILGVLVTILTMMLTAMNIVREREIGTIEQLNVTPIRKYQFIIGKLLPFLFIGLFDLAIGLTAGKLIFDIPMLGSLWLVFAFCVVNLIATLAVGMLISTAAETQQQAMFISWFFMMIFILMSGLFTPIDSMPLWAQYLTIPNPIAHFVDVMRKVLLKGSGFDDIKDHFYTMLILGPLLISLAIWRYRKTIA
ncbi:MAG: ABC transporter permease [Saprospiraceae bacterium]|jgi:ABC-2 type transport system permease protein|nr:ABC transporter permease [Saprospiraceae bacterium]